MSLDEIIASRSKQRPVQKKGGAGAGGHSKKAFKSSQHNKTKFHHNNHTNHNNNNNFLQRGKVAEDDMEGEEEEEEEEASPAVPLRPMKMVTVSRPKIVTPSSSSPSSSTVFQRLGSGTALVKFENLKSTVAQADIAELCGSVGRVKDVRLTRGEGVAVVTFERSADAEACVKQYNGLALDGQVMRVSLGSPQPATVFSRLQQPTGQALASSGASPSLAQPLTGSNIRQGLFGTALGKEKDEAHRGRTVSLQQEQQHHHHHPRQKAGKGPDTKQRQTKSRNPRREVPKEQDLDADLEDYMAQR